MLYRTPWAKTYEDETTHKNVMEAIGKSFKKEKNLFIIIYLITIFAFTDEELIELKIPMEHLKKITKTQEFLRILLKRYLKNVYGVKIGMGYYSMYTNYLKIIKVNNSIFYLDNWSPKGGFSPSA